MHSLGDIHAAVHERDFVRAERSVEALSDACSIHAQSEDEVFVGLDHGFPHETLDELVERLRAGVQARVIDRALIAIHALGQALVSDIDADRVEMARLEEETPWRWACARWLGALPT